jgi:hypothetical protein
MRDSSMTRLQLNARQSLLAMTLAMTTLSLGGCDQASPPAAPAASAEAPLPDVRGHLRLNQAERDRHIQTCTSNMKIDARGGIKIVGSIAEVRRKWDATVKPVCDCLINQYEDRSSKLEFLMLMGDVSRGVIPGTGSPSRDETHYWPIAKQAGFSPVQFQSSRDELKLIGSASVKYCAESMNQ